VNNKILFNVVFSLNKRGESSQVFSLIFWANNVDSARSNSLKETRVLDYLLKGYHVGFLEVVPIPTDLSTLPVF
jgi:hypothetical protein